MRVIKYLSPSSISKWRENRDEFYLTYLSEVRAPRFPQTRPMSIGSAADAFIKSFLYDQLFGGLAGSRFELKAIFEKQVEPQNRDWAWDHGKHAFDCYKRSGALADLLIELQSALGTPRFEIDIEDVVKGFKEGLTQFDHAGVNFMGKPDVFYVNRYGMNINLDFKVNGWCSKASPMPGYLRIRSGSGKAIVEGPHKNCFTQPYKGTLINCGQYLEQLNKDWATQLAIYGWLCGSDVGSDTIVAIDQFACVTRPGETYPEVRIAEHRLRIHSDFQWQLFAECQQIWDILHSDHIFRDLTLEDSKAKCQLLDLRAKGLANPETEDDKIFNQMTRG